MPNHYDTCRDECCKRCGQYLDKYGVCPHEKAHKEEADAWRRASLKEMG